MANQNTVTKEQIEALLDEAQTEEVIFFEKDLNICYRLKSGFTVIGRAACVDPANFDIEIGRKIAREDAENKLWQLEGYLLQNRLFSNG